MRKCSKQLKKLKFGQNEVKSKMEFRAYNSKGVDKNGAKCNMGFGQKLRRGGQKNSKCNMGFDSDTFTKKMIKTAEK